MYNFKLFIFTCHEVEVHFIAITPQIAVSKSVHFSACWSFLKLLNFLVKTLKKFINKVDLTVHVHVASVMQGFVFGAEPIKQPIQIQVAAQDPSIDLTMTIFKALAVKSGILIKLLSASQP